MLKDFIRLFMYFLRSWPIFKLVAFSGHLILTLYLFDSKLKIVASTLTSLDKLNDQKIYIFRYCIYLCHLHCCHWLVLFAFIFYIHTWISFKIPTMGGSCVKLVSIWNCTSICSEIAFWSSSSLFVGVQVIHFGELDLQLYNVNKALIFRFWQSLMFNTGSWSFPGLGKLSS